jgi:hypothetical protein
MRAGRGIGFGAGVGIGTGFGVGVGVDISPSPGVSSSLTVSTRAVLPMHPITGIKQTAEVEFFESAVTDPALNFESNSEMRAETEAREAKSDRLVSLVGDISYYETLVASDLTVRLM